MSVKIKLKHSAVNGKAPLPSDLTDGELALNTNAATPAAYIKDSAGNIVKLAGAGAITNDWTRTGTTLAPKTAGDVVNISAGTAALPGLTPVGDPDSGLFSPGADQVALPTGGTGGLFVDASGRVAIGNASPGAKLHVYQPAGDDAFEIIEAQSIGNNVGLLVKTGGNNLGYFASDGTFGGTATDLGISAPEGKIVLRNGALNAERACIDARGNVGIGSAAPNEKLTVADSGSANVYIALQNSATGTTPADGWYLGAVGEEFQIYGKDNGAITFSQNSLEKARIDTSGRLLVGTSTNTGFVPPGESFTTAATVQVSGSSASGTSSLQVTDTVSADYGLGGSLFLNKRRSDNAGNGVDQTFGSILFAGWDTAALRVGASIKATADGSTWTSGSCPSRLVFSVVENGASATTERMRIKSSGVVNIAVTTVYADNTAAKAGGLVAGDIYRKADGTLMITF